MPTVTQISILLFIFIAFFASLSVYSLRQVSASFLLPYAFTFISPDALYASSVSLFISPYHYRFFSFHRFLSLPFLFTYFPQASDSCLFLFHTHTSVSLFTLHSFLISLSRVNFNVLSFTSRSHLPPFAFPTYPFSLLPLST